MGGFRSEVKLANAEIKERLLLRENYMTCMLKKIIQLISERSKISKCRDQRAAAAKRKLHDLYVEKNYSVNFLISR